MKLFSAISLASFVLLSGCASTQDHTKPLQAAPAKEQAVSWYPIKADTPDHYSAGSGYLSSQTIEVAGKKRYLNESGEVVVTDSELELLQARGARVFNPRPIDGVEVDGEELAALMQDEDAMFAFLNNPNYRGVGDVSFVLKEGALKDNMERMARNYHITNFRWELDYSYHVPERKVIVAKNFEELLAIVAQSFPIEAVIESPNTANSLMRVFPVDGYEDRIAFTVKKGSLKRNFERLSDLAGWNTQWGFKYDFNVPKTHVVRGSSFKDILGTLITLYDFPIAAESDKQ